MNCKRIQHEWQERDRVVDDEPLITNGLNPDNYIELVCIHCNAYQVVERGN